MRGFAQSFSLSVGCAAIASHVNAVGAMGTGSLSDEERAQVLFRWSLSSVRGGRAILRRAGFDLSLEPPPRKSILNYKV